MIDFLDRDHYRSSSRVWLMIQDSQYMRWPALLSRKVPQVHLLVHDISLDHAQDATTPPAHYTLPFLKKKSDCDRAYHGRTREPLETSIDKAFFNGNLNALKSTQMTYIAFELM